MGADGDLADAHTCHWPHPPEPAHLPLPSGSREQVVEIRRQKFQITATRFPERRP